MEDASVPDVLSPIWLGNSILIVIPVVITVSKSGEQGFI